jgi:hypothetical protein
VNPHGPKAGITKTKDGHHYKTEYPVDLKATLG